ncbi:hypothetical protein [Bathymodiolus thermophilus thioautotrophic gill symbiont]|uniref:Uncharacterized protein n=1 Tax=Bathymodiolus thermophilus thioautotrophic gill symbiont TaxID=2360 RepID=A0A1J5U6A9_9GAMM|nr:hypothetical protein [Bathymodiolus thermophilus thioautotrophic gill symbiont]OIR24358.1 hypothetical protein BGC33_03290 [Bathymodiolus thermophilus thioautotrophic gill symbiont]
MKNQYFGDINDYKKFGLLRSIMSSTDIKLLIAWMLTEDDGSTDGKFIKYLQEPKKWKKFDPPLYDEIQNLLKNNGKRKVSLIEESAIMNNCKYHARLVPDQSEQRDTWFASLISQSKKFDLVFLDPDNGLEVKSKPYGRKNSSKHLYWQEISKLWAERKSLLIYQHFSRNKGETKEIFTNLKLGELSKKTKNSMVTSFTTSKVLFLLALQPEHHKYKEPKVKKVQSNWAGQIDCSYN